MHGVQISNPVDGEAVYLRHNEYVEFTVPPEYRIEIKGRLLVLRDWYTDGEISIYRVCYVSIGTENKVFLGNVYIGTDGDMKCLPIYLRALKDTNGVTIADPVGQEVEISSHEMIEVVINDTATNIYPYIVTKTGEVQMEHLRTESFSSAADTRKRSFFSLTRLLQSRDNEHHFWFRVRPAEIPSLLSNELYSAGTITFTSTEKRNLKYSLPIKVFSREWQQSIAKDRMLECAYSGCDYVKLDGMDLGLKRLVDEEAGLVINPNTGEQIDFVVGQKFMLVEMPQPSYLCKTLHKSAIWEARIKQSWNNRDRLEVEEIAPRYVNYTKVQRFIIKNKMEKLDLFSGVRLGNIIFMCGQYLYRDIDFWMLKEREDEEPVGAMGFTLNDLLPKLEEPERKRTCPVSKVHFEEIKTARLQDGEKVVPLITGHAYAFKNGKLRIMR